jgi:MFS family permease
MRLTGRARPRTCTPSGPVEGDGLDRDWVLVGVLSVTVTVSYGVLMYAFPVMLAPMQAELGWPSALLTAGFSAAVLAAGIAAIPIGRWIDRFGPRVVMTTGSAAAVVLLLAWSRVHDPVHYVLVWIGLGACMAAVFYEPAFAVIVRRFRTHRARALSIITLAGALASTVFVPLASWLVVAAGWRTAVVWLAVALGTLTILPHGLLPHTRAANDEHCAGTSDSSATVAARDASCSGMSSTTSVAARDAFRRAEFRWLATAFFLSTIANFAVAVHLIPLLLERGFTAAAAATALALLGLAKLPGRAIVAPLTSRRSARAALIIVLAVQAIGLVALSVLEDAVGTWIFIALFGAGDGASTPARAEAIAEQFGSAEYGRIGGVVGFVLSLGRFVAPAGASLIHALGGYAGVIRILVLVVVAAALAMTRVRREGPASRRVGEDMAASFCDVCRLPV